jgi:hypothetical protein
MENKFIETLIRGLLTGGVWLVILALLTIGAIVTSMAGVTIPILVYALPLMIGGFLTMLIWTDYSWEIFKTNVLGNIREQIDEQLSELSEEELEEAVRAIQKAKVELGIDKAKREPKKKREAIDERLRQLSDSDLLRIRERLQDETLDDDEIIDMLDAIQLEKERG